MGAIYKKELRSYFCSMIGYVFCAAMLVFIGVYFVSTNIKGGAPKFAYSLTSIMIIMLFTVPILSMRSFAEEKKAKTDQLLLTYPVSTTKIVLGKFLAMMTVIAIPFAISCTCPIIIAAYGEGYLAVDYSTIFAMLCLGAVFASIGMFISTLTENQLIAAVLTFGALLILCMWDYLVQFIPTSASASLLGLIVIVLIAALAVYALTKNRIAAIVIAAVGLIVLLIVYFTKMSLLQGLLPTVLGYFSCTQPIYSFAYNNVFDLGGVFLYISVAALFLFLTVQAIQKRRWS